MNIKKLIAVGVVAAPVLLIWATEGIFTTIFGVAALLPCALAAFLLWKAAS